MNGVRPPIWIALRAHLAADPRKTVVLVVLFVVMAVIYVRLFWGHGAPESADAASVVPATGAAGSGAPAGPALPYSPTRVKPARPLVRELARDPFAVRLERFEPGPQDNAQPGTATQVPATQPASGQQDFLLQSTISGTLPMAWINGRCIQPGDTIDGYQLERVEPARVVLRKDNDVRVLKMD